MDRTIDQLNLNLFSGDPLSLTALLVNLLVGFLMGGLIYWHFRRFGSTLSNRNEFGKVLPFILVTTILIISIVKSSLALSLGLVGALSIVRFRTPIKEPEELAYLFLAIAIGLGLGADQTVATIVVALLILVFIAAVRWKLWSNEPRGLYLSVDWSETNVSNVSIDAVNDVISHYATSSDLRRVDHREGDSEVTYFLQLSDSSVLTAIYSF